jgi:hypothetical protein
MQAKTTPFSVPTVTRLPINIGDRVTHAKYGPGFNGTLVRWGKPEWACSDQHIVSPGMRIAIVQTDLFGERPFWECDALLNGQPIYRASK